MSPLLIGVIVLAVLFVDVLAICLAMMAGRCDPDREVDGLNRKRLGR